MKNVDVSRTQGVRHVIHLFFESSLGKVYRLVNEIRAIALVQAGTQANQFASAIDRAGNITKFTENRGGKSFFFLKLKRDLSLNFFVCHTKSKIVN